MDTLKCRQVLEDRAKEVETFFKPDSDDSNAEDGSSKQEEVVEKLSTATELDDGNQDSSCRPASVLVSADGINDELTKTSEEPTAAAGQLLRSFSPPLEENAMDTFEAGSGHPPDCARDPSERLPHADSDDSMDGLTPVFSHKEKIDYAKRLSIAKVSVPTLHGRPGELLDLDGGDASSIPIQKEKVNSLMELFVQQVQTSANKKSPQKKEMQIK